ncbi:hypothetical protein [Thauera humireducens]|uniref:hypothetical protein n=1 Tax=Thauera humireducens TaxID=1134435 RepID=UPI00311FAD68
MLGCVERGEEACSAALAAGGGVSAAATHSMPTSRIRSPPSMRRLSRVRPAGTGFSSRIISVRWRGLPAGASRSSTSR